MMSVTLEWINKAEGDFAIVTRELRVRKNPIYDGVCFHAQQCAEKYMKALLQENKVEFRKTHNLIELLEQVITIDPLWESNRTSLAVLNTFSVNTRYPGFSADKQIAVHAKDICKDIRRQVRTSLHLKD
jgi:HEPN domain-containing protein